MLARRLLLAAALMAGALLCVRLGFWQLRRLGLKRSLNDQMASLLAKPAVPLSGAALPPDSLLGRRASMSGRYDESRQVLMSGLIREGEPGVHVLTPLVLADGGAVLVDRGWLPAQDGVTARPQELREPGPRSVVGMVEPILRGLPSSSWRVLEADSAVVWSVHALGWDSVRTHFPYPVAGFTLRQLPAAGLPQRPMRTAPEPIGTTMHLSYAIQWFLFAAACAAGALFTLSRSASARASGTRA